MFGNWDLPTIISRVIVLMTAFSVHEFAHAWTADYFGDRTPRMNGRLTLNPMAHLDPIGSVMLILAGFGWAKPVPVNPYVLQRRSRSALMWVSLAGPLSNLIMAVVAAIPFKVGLVQLSDIYLVKGNILPTLPQFLFDFVYINLVLMLFNLIPIAPLDGEKIAEYFFPPSWKETLARLQPYGPLIILFIFLAGPMLGLDIFRILLEPPMRLLLKLLIG